MPSSAASRVVETYELAYHIFKHVKNGASNSGLLSLTVSSRSVGSVALDVLWETQESLLPLFRVLGARMRISTEQRYGWETMDCGDYRCVQETHQTLSLQPHSDNTVSVLSEEWDRLQFYARRIKIIDDKPLLLDETFDVHVQRPTLIALFSRRSAPLLPCVHRLHLGPRMRALFEAADVRVRSVGDSDTRMVSILLTDQPGPRRWLPGNLCHLDGLHALRICLDRELSMFPILRSLECLEELHLGFPDPDDDDDLYHPVTGRKAQPALGFPMLKTLCMDVPSTLRGPATALEAMSTEPLKLEGLHVLGYAHEYDSSEFALELYSVIRESCDQAALKELTVVTHTLDEYPSISPRALFKDLIAFPNITCADIHICAMEFDIDGALDVLTQAWPQLVRLRFLSRPQRPWEGDAEFSPGSLEGIACLARRCPNLSYLSLDMTLDSVPDPVLASGQPLLDRRVTLNVGPQRQLTDGIQQDSMDALLRYLASIFPYPTLECVNYENGGYYRAWLWDDHFREPEVDGEGEAKGHSTPARKSRKKVKKHAKKSDGKRK